MKYEHQYLHCSIKLQKHLAAEIAEAFEVVSSIEWQEEFSYRDSAESDPKLHQQGYNAAMESEFRRRGWQSQPKLSDNPRLIGDFGKNLVFVEVQFGNSATLYRDFYKFQYGVQNGLVSLNILITPTTPKEFFPTRPSSVFNMAEYSLALRYFSVLPIAVPTLVIGLNPLN